MARTDKVIELFMSPRNKHVTIVIRLNGAAVMIISRIVSASAWFYLHRSDTYYARKSTSVPVLLKSLIGSGYA